jgi:hypothetical protein
MEKKSSKQKGFGVFLTSIPWPWHVGLGGIGWLILYALAGRDIPMPGQTPEETALYTHRLVWKNAAAIFQYLIPAFFGLLAFLSYRRKDK